MVIVFVVIVAVLILAALAVVILPLMRAAPTKDAEGSGDDSERLSVLADGMRELDTELEAGTLDRAEYEEAKTELERQALEADDTPERRASSAGRAESVWVPALVVGIALPLLAIVLYAATGTPAGISVGPSGPSRPSRPSTVRAQRAGGGSNAHVKAVIAKVKKQLQTEGGDAKGWTLLARAYRAMGRSLDAINAYQKAVGLAPKNAELLIEYASTLATLHGGNFKGMPKQLINRALTLEPDNKKVLALAGIAALQQGNNHAAVRYWRHLRRVIPADSPKRAQVNALIARAQGKQPAVVTKTAIRGTVTVADGLAETVTAGDTLFIFARAPDGPPMPVAVMRVPAPQFPLQFTLNNTQAMVSGLRLSQFSTVNIVARISRTGSAKLQPGDLEGHVNSVPVGSNDVRIIIDNRVGG